jgi:O-acetyl-ADP-ribose deacetylase
MKDIDTSDFPTEFSIKIAGSVLKIIKGSIIDIQAETIVNAANPSLRSGAGVCGAIFNAAGITNLQNECNKLGGCTVGNAKITDSYKLKNFGIRKIIHAVGPDLNITPKQQAKQLLESVYRTSLELAVLHSLKTIAFPAISCGIYGYPVDEASAIAIKTVLDFLRQNQNIDIVYLVCYREQEYYAYLKSAESILGRDSS